MHVVNDSYYFVAPSHVEMAILIANSVVLRLSLPTGCTVDPEEVWVRGTEQVAVTVYAHGSLPFSPYKPIGQLGRLGGLEGAVLEVSHQLGLRLVESVAVNVSVDLVGLVDEGEGVVGVAILSGVGVERVGSAVVVDALEVGGHCGGLLSVFSLVGSLVLVSLDT